MSDEEIKRFFAKVDKSGDCWEWRGSLAPNGYGQFFRKSGSRQAHRISWELENGPIKNGLFVCHHCDNRKCIRPSHLFLGTHSDNMRDMERKGRGNLEARKRAAKTMLRKRRVLRGEENTQRKLTKEQAELAKACPRKRGAATRMAEAFGVSLTVITDIRNGKRWTQLPAPDHEARQRAEAFLRTIGKWKEAE